MNQSAQTSSSSLNIAVAGATGFIGQALPSVLADKHRLIGLTRHQRDADAGYSEFRETNLFSLSETEKGLSGADCAIYLVHSMMPSARLVQGHFSNLDLMCADNFARAAASQGVKHIIYIGGLLPQIPEDQLSSHLMSRLEVERALATTSVPVTTLRAGLIIGQSGSSYQLLARLVNRLPLMVCPSWTRTKMQPIGIDDMLRAIQIIVDREPTKTQTFDVACQEEIDYLKLMKKTSTALGLRRRFMTVPFLSPQLSRLWVSLTTGAPKPLVAPLIESLTHEMTARETHRFQDQGFQAESVMQALERAKAQPVPADREPRAFQPSVKTAQQARVHSVQRMTLPKTKNAHWAQEEYLRWLQKNFWGGIKVNVSEDDQSVRFMAAGMSKPLLIFTRNKERSFPDRAVLQITGGLLCHYNPAARLEFRSVLDSKTLLVAIHDFVPSLPWWLYRVTQAKAHLIVMEGFRRHLERVCHDAEHQLGDS